MVSHLWFPSGCQAVRLPKGSSLRVSTRQPQMVWLEFLRIVWNVQLLHSPFQLSRAFNSPGSFIDQHDAASISNPPWTETWSIQTKEAHLGEDVLLMMCPQHSTNMHSLVWVLSFQAHHVTLSCNTCCESYFVVSLVGMDIQELRCQLMRVLSCEPGPGSWFQVPVHADSRRPTGWLKLLGPAHLWGRPEESSKL